MTGLVGEYRHKIDAKGRLSLPSDFRKILSKDLKVTVSPQDDCLFVFESAAFDGWVASFFGGAEGYQENSVRHERLRKVLNSRARSVEVDGSGRIALTAEMREKSGLGKDAVFVGNTDRLEIWDAKRWDEYCSTVDLAELYQD